MESLSGQGLLPPFGGGLLSIGKEFVGRPPPTQPKFQCAFFHLQTRSNSKLIYKLHKVWLKFHDV